VRRAAAFLLLLAAGCGHKGAKSEIAYVSFASVPPGVFAVDPDSPKPIALTTDRVWLAAPPCWSPDGRVVGWTAELSPDVWGATVMDLSARTPSMIAKGYKLEGFSPDGASVLLTNVVDVDKMLEGVAKEKKRRELQQIHRAALDGSGLKKISDGKGWDFAPVWSPDGARVAFIAERSDQLLLSVMDADGKNVKRLATSKGRLDSPVWSPDGKSIAYACENGGSRGVCLVPSDGGPAKQIASAWSDAPAFSPDGSKIAFASGPDKDTLQISVMPAGGGEATALTSGGSATSPAWSPDGTRIAYVSTKDGHADIWVMRANGGGAKNLTKDAPADSHPTWQPVKAISSP
jgi:Tol biopolymer transport system component